VDIWKLLSLKALTSRGSGGDTGDSVELKYYIKDREYHAGTLDPDLGIYGFLVNNNDDTLRSLDGFDPTKPCVITFDGVTTEHQPVPFDLTAVLGMAGTFWGNIGLVSMLGIPGEDTGEPYVFAYTTDGLGMMITTDTELTPHTISIATPVSQSGGGGDENWIGDGNTHIWISLPEGRTSPMLGVCPNGTVTVDWGDGTAPDTLTGTKLYSAVFTPNHEYAAPGDYVITLTCDGEMALNGSGSNGWGTYMLMHTSASDYRNYIYANAIQKVEVGNCVTWLRERPFHSCDFLKSVFIPDSVTSIPNYAFMGCKDLESIVMPSRASSDNTNNLFDSCCNLKSVVIPDGITSIGVNAFNDCYALESVVIPDSVTSINGNAFRNCYHLKSIVIPNSLTNIPSGMFYSCRSLESIVIPGSVTQIGSNAFNNCYGCTYYDFTQHTAVPTLSSVDAFSYNAPDCQIRVPAALYDEWIAATNWTTYASNIVAV
jgi:hypothetical protein